MKLPQPNFDLEKYRKMRIREHIIISILAFSSLVGCEETTKKETTQNMTGLSDLVIEGKTANRLVVNRIPDYGYAGRDGCVVKKEISMNITQLESNFINGTVFDSKTKEPLCAATLNLYTKVDTIKINAEPNGYFEKRFNGGLKKIAVEESRRYRNLRINLGATEITEQENKK